MTNLVDNDEFATYLNNPNIDGNDARATAILGYAQALCETVVSPLPDTDPGLTAVKTVIIDVAERSYTNAMPSNTEGFFANETAASAMGGMWLTANNVRTLRRAAGRGGAFTIDTTPATAGQNLPWWDVGAPYSAGDAGWYGGV